MMKRWWYLYFAALLFFNKAPGGPTQNLCQFYRIRTVKDETQGFYFTLTVFMPVPYSHRAEFFLWVCLACVSLILLHVWHLSNHFSLPEEWKHSTSVYYCRQLTLKPNCPKILIKVQECSLQQKEIPVSKHFHINPLSNNVRFSLLHQSSCGLRSSVQTLFKLQIPILNQSNLTCCGSRDLEWRILEWRVSRVQ